MSDGTSGLRRRVKVTIELEADSWEEAAHALNGIQFRLFEAHQGQHDSVQVTSGGVTRGWHMEGDQDCTVTHDSYFAGVEAYLAEKRAERAAADE